MPSLYYVTSRIRVRILDHVTFRSATPHISTTIVYYIVREKVNNDTIEVKYISTK